ncbi:MAG: DUF2934 domain-containing protein [Acidobacteria bacterium]|nr:DUF2934 domain-containing protein [Acidobacteriota bacterium]
MAVDDTACMAKTRKRVGEAPSDPSVEQPADAQDVRGTVASNGNADRVAARAYELYLARGGSHGNDWEDWLTAEREIMGRRPESQER